ncbi:MAG: alginate export family protein [Pedobacter sp.]|nr:alginate export family protein [Pedobacter sp.]
MKHSVIFSSVILAGAMAGAAHADPMEIALLQEAIFSGKTSLDLRLRSEWVDDSVKQDANAQTLRTVLGYKTGDYHGFKAFIEFEDVGNFGREYYNSGIPGGNTKYATIGDPEVTQVNQAFLEGYGAKVGRQKIVFDNARFIGDVGWRQNDQTFDAVGYSNNSLIKDFTFTLDYVSKVNPPTGITRPVRAPMVNLRYAAFPAAKTSLFHYAVEEKNSAAGGNLTANSWQHDGLRVDGAIADFLYEASYAQQKDYAEGTTPDANYYDLQLGYKFGPVTLKAQHEVLEKGFKTPFATLHAFNGWADRFLTTPTNGLQDSNLKVLAKFAGVNFVLAGHMFKADENSSNYGNEIDFSAGYQIFKNLSVLAKMAKYNADSETAALTGTIANKDLSKYWLQFAYKM